MNDKQQVTLFIDEASVDSCEGVTFHANQATKHPENPVLLPGRPDQWDSLQVTWPATVLHSPVDGLFRCWYSGFDAVQRSDRLWECGYAQSEDGIHWAKPELGQATYLDKPTNRIELPWKPSAFVRLVFECPDCEDSSKRFGCMYLDLPSPDEGDAARFKAVLAWSEDGINWSPGDMAYESAGPDRPSYQDICQVLFDMDDLDPNSRVKGFSQFLHKRAWDGRENVRHIGLTQGASIEFLEDAVDPVILSPEEGIDEELHGCSVKKIGQTYLMLYESDIFTTYPLHGDLKLAVSTDGRSFRRVHSETPIVATGSKGMWDENLLITTSDAMQEVGDEIFIYYIGCPNLYNHWPPEYAVTPSRRGSMLYPTYLGVAVLQRDRFAYAQGTGTLTTFPINAAEDGIWINAEGDEVTISAVDIYGREVAVGHLGSQINKGVYRKVIWDKAEPTGEFRLRIEIRSDCKVYSISH